MNDLSLDQTGANSSVVQTLLYSRPLVTAELPTAPSPSIVQFNNTSRGLYNVSLNEYLTNAYIP